MPLKLANNATSVLAGTITSVATSLSVEAGTGARFPSLQEGDWFPLTLVDASGNHEIVRVTARSGDVFTTVRAQEETQALAFAAGDRCDLRFTAGAIAEFVQRAVALQRANNLSDLADKEMAREALGLSYDALSDTHTHDFDDLANQPSIGAAAARGLATAEALRANEGTGVLTTDQVWAAAGWVDLGRISGAVTIDCAKGNRFSGVLAGNVTVSIANPKNAQTLDLSFSQDAEGSRTVSWSAGQLRWPNNSAPAINPTANDVALVVSCIRLPDGTFFSVGLK